MIIDCDKQYIVYDARDDLQMLVTLKDIWIENFAKGPEYYYHLSLEENKLKELTLYERLENLDRITVIGEL